MAKDNRPKANPAHCIQSLEAYFETQTQLRNILPEAIKELRNYNTKPSNYIADLLEKHNKTLQEFHDSYLD